MWYVVYWEYKCTARYILYARWFHILDQNVFQYQTTLFHNEIIISSRCPWGWNVTLATLFNLYIYYYTNTCTMYTTLNVYFTLGAHHRRWHFICIFCTSLIIVVMQRGIFFFINVHLDTNLRLGRIKGDTSGENNTKSTQAKGEGGWGR